MWNDLETGSYSMVRSPDAVWICAPGWRAPLAAFHGLVPSQVEGRVDAGSPGSLRELPGVGRSGIGSTTGPGGPRELSLQTVGLDSC